MKDNQMKHKAKTIESGACCPYCACGCIEADSSPDFEGNTCSYEVYCLSCERKWLEIYTMTNVLGVR